MAIASILRRRARAVIAPLLGALFVGYFAYHAVQGDRGLLSYLRLAQEIRKAEITRDLIQAERFVIEKHVRLLRFDALDLDMLDERARIMLNLGRSDELMVILQRTEEQPPMIIE